MTAHIEQDITLRRGPRARARDGGVRERPPDVKSTSRSRARLSLVLLLYCLGLVVVITVAPFRFAVPSHVDVAMTAGWSAVVMNVLLFVPLGFLYPLTRRASESRPARVFVVGLLVSAALETTHAFEPDRFFSLVAVLTNASGASVGAMLLGAINGRIRRSPKLAGRLSLETPLIGLIYLLIPLLLVAALSAVDDSLRLLSLIPLGLIGARLIAAVQEFHFGPAGVFRNRAVAFIAAGWMVLGIYPVVLRYPLVGVGLTVLVACATWYESSRPAVHMPERRFEGDVLRSVALMIALYVLVIAIAPLTAGIGRWSLTFGFTGSGGDLTRQMLRALEPIAALTVLGYAIAEARGRRELPFRAIAPRLLAECACVAMAIEASRGFQRDTGASVAQLALTIGAGLLGARIYHDQREHVRRILIHSRSTSNGASITPGKAQRVQIAISPHHFPSPPIPPY